MDNAVNALVRAWLVRAQHDLGSARRLAEAPDPYFDTAAYHCQQAAEKAVKALLVFYGERFEKVHNIPVLVSQGMRHVPELIELLDSAEALTPYATLYRYPGTFDEPTGEEYQQTIAHAERIYARVLSLLPEGVRP